MYEDYTEGELLNKWSNGKAEACNRQEWSDPCKWGYLYRNLS